ncbi:glycoside hydrolase family 5 protein [Hirschia litorea]|uniref:Glycoside hydrolase family 5 protein n=1 Tax=Hirschia litorea TaxID=1199156 RepID=A0ABW2IGT3_9PROT
MNMKLALMSALSLGALIVGGGYYVLKGYSEPDTNSYIQTSIPEGPVDRCINLGNALDAPNEGDWTYRIEDEHLKAIADAGFQSVRVPVRWSAHADDAPPYEIDPKFMDRVVHVVDEAIAHDLKVVLNVHHYLEIMEDPNAHVERLEGMWGQIARRFAGRGDKIVFELLNEATENLTNTKLEKINAALVVKVRNIVGAEPWIMVGGDNWGNFDGIKNARIPDDPRLILTFHDYSPFEFTHQGATFTEQEFPTGKVWGSEKERDDALQLFEDARELGIKRQVPIFLGEFGVINTVPQDERVKWTEAYRKAAEENGIGWCLWDFGAAFSIYDTQTERWEKPLLDALLKE